MVYMTSLLDSVGEGKGGMFQENSIETCILSRVLKNYFTSSLYFLQKWLYLLAQIKFHNTVTIANLIGFENKVIKSIKCQ